MLTSYVPRRRHDRVRYRRCRRPRPRVVRLNMDRLLRGDLLGGSDGGRLPTGSSTRFFRRLTTVLLFGITMNCLQLASSSTDHQQQHQQLQQQHLLQRQGECKPPKRVRVESLGLSSVAGRE